MNTDLVLDILHTRIWNRHRVLLIALAMHADADGLITITPEELMKLTGFFPIESVDKKANPGHWKDSTLEFNLAQMEKYNYIYVKPENGRMYLNIDAIKKSAFINYRKQPKFHADGGNVSVG